MCLAVPAKIVEITGDMAVVEIGGVKRSCNVTFVHEPRIGDLVLLHAGFAIQKWSEQDYLEYREIVDRA